MGILMSKKQINIVLSQNDSWQCYNVKKGEKMCVFDKTSISAIKHYAFAKQKMKKLSLESQSKMS